MCLCAGQHPVDPVGVAASLPAVFPQLTDVGQRIQSTAEICLPRLWIWFVFAWPVPSWSDQAKGTNIDLLMCVSRLCHFNPQFLDLNFALC